MQVRSSCSAAGLKPRTDGETYLNADRSTAHRQRPYHVECTASRPISEVKQRRVWLVLGWETAWEHRMLLAFLFYQIKIVWAEICVIPDKNVQLNFALVWFSQLVGKLVRNEVKTNATLKLLVKHRKMDEVFCKN